ncbi:hypothetical protein PLESTB_001856000 [Pleodorina starrii]|uniref:Pherophorin domain-containing protein n=1 Tax=Pleodorina starrii TaxID=330485 RepID=A0A9W6C1K8_9CHLO|nr:hypothetical protein PLESTB_001856000 [Pleodorina starrii]GLC74019.1 hypothetical protein PLESTF_001450900 [Pleodorina starrii]
MMACANFTAGSMAGRFVNMTKYGDATTNRTTGFLVLASPSYLNMNSGLQPDSSGQPICAPSSLVMDQYSYTSLQPEPTRCDSANISTPCKLIPPRSNFPYCDCDLNAPSRTPYTLSYTRKFSQSSYNYFCFGITVNNSTCGRSKCCNMDLFKVEWLVNDATCFRSVAGYTLRLKGGKAAPKSMSWSRYNDTALRPSQMLAVMKTNNLGLNMGNANGAELCLALQAKIPQCATLSQLCYNGASTGCRYALFERAASNGCCARNFVNGPFGAITSSRPKL